MIELELKGYNIQTINQPIAIEFEKNIKFFKEWYDCKNLALLTIFVVELYRFRINSILSVHIFF